MFSLLIKIRNYFFRSGNFKSINPDTEKVVIHVKKVGDDTIHEREPDTINHIDWDVVDRLVDENFKSWLSRKEDSDRENSREEREDQASENTMSKRGLETKVHKVTGADTLDHKIDRLRVYVRDKERMAK